MMLFAETPELIAYKEIVGDTMVVTFESSHSETFSVSAQVRAGVDVADSLFMKVWQQYVDQTQVQVS